MVTGVWSKRINEANERSGQSMNSAGMVAGMTTLCFVIGLGFRMKLQMIRNFAGELYDVVHGDRVRMAQEAVRRGATSRHFDPKHGFRTQSTQHEAGQHDRQRRQQHQHQQQQQQQQQEQQRRRQQEQQTYWRHANERREQAWANAATSDVLDRYRKILGVHAGATKSELKAAYYAAAKRHHPDAGGSTVARSTSGEEFTQLKLAYDTLRRRA